MKHCLMIITAMILFACPALAQNPNYRLELYADAGQSKCALEARQPGLVTVHVFMKGDAPTTGLLFAIYLPSCFSSATWIDDHVAQPWATVGSTQIPFGLSIGFGECAQLPLYIGHFDFMAPGLTSDCCQLDVSHPTSWTYFSTPMLATDCDFKEWTGSASSIIINPTETCSCANGVLLATKPTTWGSVKSLYR